MYVLNSKIKTKKVRGAISQTYFYSNLYNAETSFFYHISGICPRLSVAVGEFNFLIHHATKNVLILFIISVHGFS